MAASAFLKRFASNPSPDSRNYEEGSHVRYLSGSPANSIRKQLLWMMGDTLLVAVAFVIAVRGWLGAGLFRQQSPYHTNPMFHERPLSVILALSWFLVSLIFASRRHHLYGPVQMRNTLHEQRLTLQACLTAGLLLSGSLYLMRGEIISRGLVLITIVATMILLCGRRLLWRLLMHHRFERGLETRNIIVVGTGRVGQALRQHLESVRHLGYSFKGFVTVPDCDTETRAADSDVLGSTDSLLEIARRYFADEIFVAAPCEPHVVKRLVLGAREAGVDIRVVPELYDGLAWNCPIEYIGQFPTIPLHRGHVPVLGLFLKRLLDVSISSLALLLLSPLLAGMALAIRMDSDGPILYRSDRIGKKGRVFCCFKFRTMVADAERRKAEILHMNERDGVLFKVSNDPRVTRLGRFLRKYSLDELPQFINVLQGDMSMVGPRPPIASEVRRYELSHLRRLEVLPGMTGLWQVQARQDPSFDSYISLDTAYINNWSIWLDMKILVRTLTVVFQGTGT
jgi:exopolysaccharide biosynthesis polyprenyl glycosylphosphotransferase